MPRRKLPRQRAGTPIRAATINALADAIERLEIRVTAPLEMVEIGGAITLRLGETGGTLVPAKVTTAITTASWTSSVCTPGGGAARLLTGGASPGSSAGAIVTVKNLYVLSASIATNKLVWLTTWNGHWHLANASCASIN